MFTFIKRVLNKFKKEKPLSYRTKDGTLILIKKDGTVKLYEG